jgi:hypothetical protein
MPERLGWVQPLDCDGKTNQMRITATHAARAPADRGRSAGALRARRGELGHG